jgi:hypothetical protein
VAIYTGAKALSRWPINDESTLTLPLDPYLFLRSIYNSSKPAADNNSQALSIKQVIRFWHETHSALDQIAALQTSIIRVGKL